MNDPEKPIMGDSPERAAVARYLDSAILHWRAERSAAEEMKAQAAASENVLAHRKAQQFYVMALHYLDAYQSARLSLVGDVLA
jgi:hypothetical protein